MGSGTVQDIIFTCNKLNNSTTDNYKIKASKMDYFRFDDDEAREGEILINYGSKNNSFLTYVLDINYKIINNKNKVIYVNTKDIVKYKKRKRMG